MSYNEEELIVLYEERPVLWNSNLKGWFAYNFFKIFIYYVCS